MGWHPGIAARTRKILSMKSTDHNIPPGVALWLLKNIHRDKGEYTHLGDFEEVFTSIQKEQGRFPACVWYWGQVIKSFPGFIMNRMYWGFAMFKNYLKIAFRNVLKSKGFSSINLAGLAVGLACFILILTYVQFELSYDRFHEKGDRVFQVLGRENSSEAGAVEYSDGIPDVVVPLLVKDFPEIVRATRYFSYTTDKAILQNENKIFYQKGLYTDSEFLQIFSYPLVEGNPEAALDNSNCMLISENVAHKLFGNSSPIGKSIVYRERNTKYDISITGVFRNIPLNSHLQFDYLLSLKTLSSDKRNSYMFNNWGVGNFKVYVETVTPQVRQAVVEKFPAFLSSHLGIPEDQAKKELDVFLQPIKDIHLKSRIRGELSSNLEIKYVYLFSSIAFIILLIACVNYMNLTTARSTTRAKEIGIRKVVGANRRQLFKQFIGESLLTASIATGIALLLIDLFLLRFNTLIGIDLRVNYLENGTLLMLIIGTTLLVGVASGIYPALVLSAFHPSRVLKEQASLGKKGSLLRNILVVIQFSASIMLIIGTVIIFSQLNYIKSARLGYDREHVVVIPVQEQETRQKAEAIKNELLQYPEVLNVSLTSGLPIDIRSRFLNVKLQKDNGETVKTTLHFDYVDENFLDVFKIKLAQGRGFSRELGGNEQGVLVNESLVKQMGWAEPMGKKVPLMREEVNVIGVVEDFHFATFHRGIDVMVLYYRKIGSRIAVRVSPGDVPERIALLRRIFEKHSQSQPFDFIFLDDAYNSLYKKEQRTGEIFGTFAFIGIFIACLGLLGLASFSVERRTKEIGIRKVLGASSTRIAGLLTKEFLWLVVIANVVAWPVAYFAMHAWLQNFAYRIGLNVWMFLLALSATLCIAIITVVTQTLKASLANPVDTLRYE